MADAVKLDQYYKQLREEGGRLQTSRVIERLHLLKFVELYSKFDDGYLVFDDKPDVIIHLPNDRTIGIEHVRIGDESIRSQMSEQERIVEKAQKQFDKTTNISLQLYVVFNDSIILTKKDNQLIVDSLYTVITQLVENAVKESNDKILIKRWQYKQSNNFLDPWNWHPSISEIYFIIDKNPEPISFWGIPRGGVSMPMDKRTLNEIISVKDTKLPGYSYCDEVWLLMVANGIPPLNYHLPDEIVNYSFVTNFHKLWYMEDFGAYIVELNSVKYC